MGSCQPIRDELAQCLLASDCVVKQGNTAQECLQQHLRELPIDCQHIYKSYVECKRGMLDMRKRFRGNITHARPPGEVTSAPPGGATADPSPLSTSNQANQSQKGPSGALSPEGRTV